ncbi:hypothetical protein [Rugamonas rivuli]|uniref:Uncharacterized protein n=1 Tax=Rugamonas rivuli TaxID=2743358 RepID=A0A843SL30_9BURK|nr:hypothetical protein [Rugamonas rivuli]MQA22791.1 hypothetical protein [Rugamonas rivuli]
MTSIEQARNRITESYVIHCVDTGLSPEQIAGYLNQRIRSSTTYPFNEQAVEQLLQAYGFQSYAAGFQVEPTEH